MICRSRLRAATTYIVTKSTPSCMHSYVQFKELRELRGLYWRLISLKCFNRSEQFVEDTIGLIGGRRKHLLSALERLQRE